MISIQGKFEAKYLCAWLSSTWPCDQGLCSLSVKMIYHQIFRSLKATRLGVEIIISLWDLSNADELPINSRAIRQLQTHTLWLPRFLNRTPVWCLVYVEHWHAEKKMTSMISNPFFQIFHHLGPYALDISVIWVQRSHKKTKPYLACEGEVWSTFRELWIWPQFHTCHCCTTVIMC